MSANLTISQRGLVLVAIPLLVLLGLVALLLAMQNNTEDSQRLALHSHEVVARAEAVQRRVAEVEAGIRGYILTGAPVFEETYLAAARVLPGM